MASRNSATKRRHGHGERLSPHSTSPTRLVRKILELPDLAISPTTVRVPVFTTHSIAINAETEQPVSPTRARKVFARFPGLQVWDDPAQNRYPRTHGFEI